MSEKSKSSLSEKGLSRRGFLAALGVGAAAAGLVACGKQETPPVDGVRSEDIPDYEEEPYDPQTPETEQGPAEVILDYSVEDNLPDRAKEINASYSNIDTFYDELEVEERLNYGNAMLDVYWDQLVDFLTKDENPDSGWTRDALTQYKGELLNPEVEMGDMHSERAFRMAKVPTMTINMKQTLAAIMKRDYEVLKERGEEKPELLLRAQELLVSCYSQYASPLFGRMRDNYGGLEAYESGDLDVNTLLEEMQQPYKDLASVSPETSNQTIINTFAGGEGVRRKDAPIVIYTDPKDGSQILKFTIEMNVRDPDPTSETYTKPHEYTMKIYPNRKDLEGNDVNLFALYNGPDYAQ